MKAALAIAKAEIRQHKLVFWAGPVVGLLPLLLNYMIEGQPLRPWVRGQPEQPGEFFVWVFAIVLSCGIAVGLGSSVVSRDLGERRLGFWLSQPQSLLQYWAGKIGAAYLLALCAFLLAVLPAHLLGSLSWADTSTVFSKGMRVWQALLCGLAVAVAAASVGGGAIRSRSGLLILDIVMLPLLWAATWFGALNGVFVAGTDGVVMLFAMPWLVLGTVPILLAAGAAQVCVGRLELRLGHALLSAITWGGLLVFFTGGILASSRYVASATPSEIRLPHASLIAPHSGDHVMIASISTTWNYLYYPGFLLDARGGFVRIGSVQGVNGFGWSRDGRTFAWSREASFSPADVPKAGQPPFSRGPGLEPIIHVVRDLGRPGSAPRRLAAELSHDTSLRAVSPSGQRLLVESSTGKQVLDAESGRKLIGLDVPERWLGAAFLSESTIRALRVNAREPNLVQQTTVVDWDLASGRVTERGTIEGGRADAGLTPTEDWQRLLRFDESGLALHDIDGREVATLVNGWTARVNHAAGLLSGGRVGCIEQEPSGLRFRVFDSEGRPVSEARFKGRFPLRVGGEIAPGVLALGVSEGGEPAVLIVDFLAGSVVRRELGLTPALRLWKSGVWEGRRGLHTATPEPGSLGTRLFLGSDGLVSLDPASGARTVLVARGGRLAEK